MCGLVGVAGNIFATEKDIFKELLFVNTLRGVHGHGCMSAYEDFQKRDWYNLYTSKRLSSTGVFTEQFKDFVKPFGMQMLAGHSRQATIGGIKKENNHPFETKKFLGMHNGTIRGDFDMSKDYDTDSEAAINLMSEIGIKKGIETIYKQAWSIAFAFVIYDIENNTVSLLRNKERTLFYATWGLNKIAWASDVNMLKFALDRSYVKNYEINVVKPFTLYRIFLNKRGKQFLTITPDYFEELDFEKRWGRKVSEVKTEVKNKTKNASNKAVKAVQKLIGNISNDNDTSYTGPTYYKIGNITMNANHIDCTCDSCGSVECSIEDMRFTKDLKQKFCLGCKDFVMAEAGINLDNLEKPQKLVMD